MDLTGAARQGDQDNAVRRRPDDVPLGLALLHLKYFVANLMREFEWKEAPGEPVEFAERLEMSRPGTVMKRPLRVPSPSHARK